MLKSEIFWEIWDGLQLCTHVQRLAHDARYYSAIHTSLVNDVTGKTAPLMAMFVQLLKLDL